MHTFSNYKSVIINYKRKYDKIDDGTEDVDEDDDEAVEEVFRIEVDVVVEVRRLTYEIE